jgi:hypothetical protein
MDLFEEFSNLFVKGLEEIIEHTETRELSTFGGFLGVDWSENSVQSSYSEALFGIQTNNRRTQRNSDIMIERMLEAVQQMMQEIDVTQNLERVNWKEEGF